MGVQPKDMLAMYKQATEGRLQNFFMIDVLTNDDRYRFRKNFEPMIPSDSSSHGVVRSRKRQRVTLKDDEDEEFAPVVDDDEVGEHMRRYGFKRPIPFS